MQIKKVILVFKTHFDIGFTKLSREVLDDYAGKMLDKAGVAALASIPSRDVLLSQLMGVMLAPVSGFARGLAALAKKKEEEAA